jgi:hypothetical protein
MAVQFDVKGVTCAAGDTAVFAGPTRLKGMVISYASGGTVVAKNGSTTIFTFTAPAAAGSVSTLIPGDGIRFDTSLNITCTNATAVVYHG